MLGIDQNRDFKPVNIALLTVSDTRTLENDKSGDTLQDRIVKAGHKVFDRFIVKDDVVPVSYTHLTLPTILRV